jgi:hypothetical protein
LIWDEVWEDDLSPTNLIAPDSEKFIDDMLNCGLSVVNETFMLDQPPQWHSEKTYKAISLMMPFIIIGQRHSLRALRDQGYQTFSPWIDESYDDIDDERDRLRAATAEARRIITLSDDNFVNFMKAVLPALAHNFQHFHSRIAKFDTNAVEQLVEVLDNLTIDKS